ncbi:PTS sugar transporter subunit IIC [[Eubacterium] hominis]|uniref:PTS sugar transporter subunit IIC n=1 Tax=[Eubacterium] hominis TaxID=2764325 RepID=UPI003A4D7C12
MNGFTHFIEEKMVPAVSKVTSLRYFQALRSGFMVIMPLTIIGSIFMLVTDFPLAGYADFMAGIFGADWASYIEPAYRATFNMMGFMLVGTMAYKLAQSYEQDALSSMVLALVAFVVVTPKSVVTESGEIVNKVLSFTWLGTQGVITAILVSIVSVEIIRFCIKKNLVIKMPDSVPEMVSKSFSALIPGILIVTIMLIVNGICMMSAGSLHELIYSIIQVPLQGLTSSLFAIVLVAALNGFLWWFGIHPTVVNSIVNPLLIANADANQSLFTAGQLSLQNGNVGTIQMIDQFATIGGAGMTIGLMIAMLMVARSARLKTMSKLAAVPACFNINEPLVFGLPIVFNPLMLIPVTLAPIVSVMIAYLAMSIGFMPLFTGVMAPWATPPIFSGFLVAGWQGAVVQVIAIIASVAIYYPFVKALDHQYAKEEQLTIEE